MSPTILIDPESLLIDPESLSWYNAGFEDGYRAGVAAGRNVCAICQAAMPPIEDAINNGWFPEVYLHGNATIGPLCGDCMERYTRCTPDGPELCTNVPRQAYPYDPLAPPT